MGVGFQPPLPALLVLAKLPLTVMGPVDLLDGHGQPTTRHLAGLVAAAVQSAKHAAGLAASGLLVGGQGFLRFLAAGDGSGQLAGAVARGLIELATEPVALGPQLGCGQPPEI